MDYKRISDLLTVTWLVITGHWKVKYDLQLQEQYKDIWNIAINDKLTCNLKVENDLLNKNMFIDI